MIDLVPNDYDLLKVKGTLNKQQNLLRAILTSHIEFYQGWRLYFNKSWKQNSNIAFPILEYE